MNSAEIDSAIAAAKARWDHAEAPHEPDALALIRAAEALREDLSDYEALFDPTTTPETRRITISVPQTIAAGAERAVEEHRAPSVSAYFAAAAERAEREDTLAALVADLVADWGPPSAQAEAWADTIFGDQA